MRVRKDAEKARAARLLTPTSYEFPWGSGLSEEAIVAEFNSGKPGLKIVPKECDQSAKKNTSQGHSNGWSTPHTGEQTMYSRAYGQVLALMPKAPKKPYEL